MAYSNALNLSMAFSGQYPASSLAFNLSNSFISGGTPGNANSFLKAPGSTGSCTWAIPTFSPSNCTITTPITAPSLCMASSSTVVTYFSATNYGILALNSTMGTLSFATSLRTIFSSNTSNIAAGAITVSGAGGLSTITRTNSSSGIALTASTRFASGTSTGTLDVNRVFIVTGGSPATFTLPSTSAVGDYIYLTPASTTAGTYIVSQTAGQYLIAGSLGTTTVGTGGYIQSTTIGVSLQMICVEANLGWAVCGGFLSSSFTIV